MTWPPTSAPTVREGRVSLRSYRPFTVTDEVRDRFWERVDKSGACWVWTAGKSANGYGAFKVEGHQQKAHRVAWQLSGRVLKDGFELDHLCRNKACVNPDHLEQVTPRENVLRSASVTAENARKEVCPKCGGEWSPRKPTGRRCIPCINANQRAVYHRRRANLPDTCWADYLL